MPPSLHVVNIVWQLNLSTPEKKHADNIKQDSEENGG